MSVTLVELNLSELEGNIRRDPESYLPDVIKPGPSSVHLV